MLPEIPLNVTDRPKGGNGSVLAKGEDKLLSARIKVTKAINKQTKIVKGKFRTCFRITTESLFFAIHKDFPNVYLSHKNEEAIQLQTILEYCLLESFPKFPRD